MKIFGLILLFSTILLPLPVLEAQETAETGHPAWLYYEKGNAAFEEKDLGRALKLYRQAMSADRYYPEAEAGMARVFQATGEYDLAIMYYNRALGQERSLYVLEEKYEILYRLSEIYQLLERWKDYEETLLRITDDQAVFSSQENEYRNLREAMFRILDTEGLNQLLILYRIEDMYTYRAHAELGDFYLHTGRNKRAKDHLTFAVVMLISRSIEAVKRFEIEYPFTTMRDFIKTAFFHDHIREFCMNNGLFKNLYYLATAMYGLGDQQISRQIWEIVASYPESRWNERAQDQLESPSQAPVTISY